MCVYLPTIQQGRWLADLVPQCGQVADMRDVIRSAIKHVNDENADNFYKRELNKEPSRHKYGLYIKFKW